MSVQDTAKEGVQQAADTNAKSAEDVKKMLAELQGETEALTGKDELQTEAITDAQEQPGLDDNKGALLDDDSHINGKTEGNTEVKEIIKNEDEADRSKPRERRDRDRDDRQSQRGRGGRGRGGGFTKTNRRDNIKSVLEKQEPSSDPVEIRKQVEFYFSDSNLPMDAFLLKQVGGSENNPVELKTIHSFKRMRHFQPFEAIVEALRESTFLELTNDDTCVRRKEPLPESLNDGPNETAVRVFEDRAMPRSIYAKGFGEEVPNTQFDIEAFFVPYGPTNAIRLRRSDDKVFKGSVFVEFENEDLAKKFLALDPKPQYQGRDLQIMSKKAYCDQKVEDIKAGKIRANPDRHVRTTRKYDNDRNYKRKRDEEDDRDWRTRREEDRKKGFRDDKRGEDRRSGREGKHERGDKDDSNTRTPKDKEADAKKRDAAKAEAIAKARAMVEAENQKAGNEGAADIVEAADLQKKKNGEKEISNTIDASMKEDDVDAVAEKSNDITDATSSKKRGREDDGEDIKRESKKIDSKTE